MNNIWRLRKCTKEDFFCFISEIIDEDQTLLHVPEEEKTESARSRFMMDTFDIFEDGTQIVDYHGIFVTKYFVAWMVMLLDALEARDIHNAVVMMYNSKYHKTLSKGTPKCLGKINSSLNTDI